MNVENAVSITTKLEPLKNGPVLDERRVHTECLALGWGYEDEQHRFNSYPQ